MEIELLLITTDGTQGPRTVEMALLPEIGHMLCHPDDPDRHFLVTSVQQQPGVPPRRGVVRVHASEWKPNPETIPLTG